MPDDQNLRLSDREISAAFDDPHWAAKFPPVLTLQQAAELLQIPLSTLYQWRSRGYLRGCARRMGKHVRVFRDRLIKQLFSDGLGNPAKR